MVVKMAGLGRSFAGVRRVLPARFFAASADCRNATCSPVSSICVKRVAREVAAVFCEPGLAESKKLAEITARWHHANVLERGFTPPPSSTQGGPDCAPRRGAHRKPDPATFNPLEVRTSLPGSHASRTSERFEELLLPWP